ncbi:hypothetical protein C8F01DRAFT_1261835 [Mycena amicta]|nr:hypothetical protein C8F01DRAFT_1261835 [Mycena amicta]
MRVLHLPPRSTPLRFPTSLSQRRLSNVPSIDLDSPRPSRAAYRSSHEERFELALGEQVVEVNFSRAPGSGLGPGLRCELVRGARFSASVWTPEWTILQNGLDD